MTLSHKQLRRWYRDYNRRYFANRLPAEMDVFYAPMNDGLAEATHYCNGEKSIVINTLVAGTRYTKGDLLHEMNHHDTGDFTHGAKFQGGMMRLAHAGAFKRIW